MRHHTRTWLDGTGPFDRVANLLQGPLTTSLDHDDSRDCARRDERRERHRSNANASDYRHQRSQQEDWHHHTHRRSL